ncbi:MAG: SGNH/GDSL hydrolase family protein [Phycisphaerales bacterium]|jgi:hypothetical protein|nr:SGNH/GDSL hydrolase family protein [Phycisphaerales bacterium]
MRWINLFDIGLEGRGWHGADSAHPYERLPARAKSQVEAVVWELAGHSSGLCARFKTDSSRLEIKWKLRFPLRTTPHMARVAETGFDLYVQRGDGLDLIGVCGAVDQLENQASLAANLTRQPRQFLTYLPLYNGPEFVQLGIDDDATLEPIAPRDADQQPPIIFYGTSITQGGFASRPGMTYPSILSRRLNWPILNLGFAGQGKMDAPMANLLGELPARAFIIDPVPNLYDPDEALLRTAPFIATLRQTHPTTPIILMESVIRSMSHHWPDWRRQVTLANAGFRQAYEQLRASDPNLHYIEGIHLIGDNGEMTVDGTHPTDWGFAQIADVLFPMLNATPA